MSDVDKRQHSPYSYLIMIGLNETADIIYDTLLRNAHVDRIANRELSRKYFLRLYTGDIE